MKEETETPTEESSEGRCSDAQMTVLQYLQRNQAKEQKDEVGKNSDGGLKGILKKLVREL